MNELVFSKILFFNFWWLAESPCSLIDGEQAILGLVEFGFCVNDMVSAGLSDQ